MNDLMKMSIGLSLGVVLAFPTANADTVQGNVSIHVEKSTSENKIDFKNAKPMGLPAVNRNTRISALETDAAPILSVSGSGYSPGAAGPAKISRRLATHVPVSKANTSIESEITPQEYGTLNHPFSTSRVDMYGLPVSRIYPYRAAGKLFFRDGIYTYVCSASLIKPGVVVTAAHCVSEYGGNRYYSDFKFVPAYKDGSAPYGEWSATHALAPTGYLTGSDGCNVVCPNDVAVLILEPKVDESTSNPFYAGDLTGYLGYAWGGYSFSDFGGYTVAQLTQLGYPVSHDSGLKMQRTESIGYVASSANAYNTTIGSRQTGGSSGGPWVVNIGQVASLSGASVGSDANSNVVVGVTSWGYTLDSLKEQGASPFTSDNIGALVDTACTLNPDACVQ